MFQAIVPVTRTALPLVGRAILVSWASFELGRMVHNRFAFHVDTADGWLLQRRERKLAARMERQKAVLLRTREQIEEQVRARLAPLAPRLNDLEKLVAQTVRDIETAADPAPHILAELGPAPAAEDPASAHSLTSAEVEGGMA